MSFLVCPMTLEELLQNPQYSEWFSTACRICLLCHHSINSHPRTKTCQLKLEELLQNKNLIHLEEGTTRPVCRSCNHDISNHTRASDSKKQTHMFNPLTDGLQILR